MALFAPSIVVDEVITALGNFVKLFIGSTEVIRAQVNRVSTPQGAYVELTDMYSAPLSTPIVTDDVINFQADITGPTRIDVQLDFYGPSAGDQSKTVLLVYRSSLAFGMFPDNIKPLYMSDGHQGPLITGEEQYEDRWTLTASLQYNPVVSIPQQSANELAVNILENIP